MSAYANSVEVDFFMFDDPSHKAFSNITGKRSIHDSESVSFYKQSLNCEDPFVISVLEHGLLMPICQNIPEYEEENNRSANENLSFLQDKVEKWESQNYVAKVTEKPHSVSPLSVASKVNLQTGETKLRPCLDLSRHVNLFLQEKPVKLSDLDSSAVLLDPGDWQMALDLENQYFHVRVNPSHQKYLGFKLEDRKGKSHYYTFRVMIYGIKIATSIVTRLIKPIVSTSQRRY